MSPQLPEKNEVMKERKFGACGPFPLEPPTKLEDRAARM